LEKNTFIAPTNVEFTKNVELPETFLNLATPLDFFNYFFTSDVMNHICEQTTKYSFLKDPNKPFNITETDLKRYLGIRLIDNIMTSISQVPNIRQYWSSNLGNSVIKSTTTVNCFEKICQFLHFADNNNYIPPNQAGHDRLYRIRPIL